MSTWLIPSYAVIVSYSCTNLGHSHVEPLGWEAAGEVSYDL